MSENSGDFVKILNNLESRFLKELFYKNFDKAGIILKQENSLLKFSKTADWLLGGIKLNSISSRNKQKLLSKNINRVFDLVSLRPLRIENYALKDFKQMQDGDYCSAKGRVYAKNRTKKLISVTIASEDGFLYCNWFRLTPFVRKLLNSIKPGDEIICEGKIKAFGYKLYMNHPVIKTPDKFIERQEIIYPSVLGMRNSTVKKMIYEVMKKQPQKPYDYLPYTIIVRNSLPFLSETIDYMHKKTNDDKVDKRLKYEELFLLILSLRLQEEYLKNKTAPAIEVNSAFMEEVIRNLDFKLTNGQKAAVNDILNDLRQKHPMLRLLQGDVGCGKTIVAFISVLAAIKSGYQTAFMAPTQTLAVQVFNEAKKFFNQYDIESELLLSSTKKKKAIYDRIESKKIDLVVATHAVLQENVKFNNLGFAVIDEQHRFGVEQRKSLLNKGRFPHILIMSATPIPRSLSMILYSKSSLSTIKEKPEGRTDIQSFHFYSKNKCRAYEKAVCEMKKHHQVYVIAPLIEESENMNNIENVTKLYEKLKDDYFKGFKIGLLHGQMKNDDKDNIVKQFKNGTIDCLISTTVIEVGIDSPNATVIIVENAERFGLSQLHQLRGRVGRSSLQSYAVFVTDDHISDTAEKRIKALLRVNDGFKISQIDYELRGSGEIMGIRQHGRDLVYTDIIKDKALINNVKNDVDRLIKIHYPINEGLLKMVEYKWQKKINYIFVG